MDGDFPDEILAGAKVSVAPALHPRQEGALIGAGPVNCSPQRMEMQMMPAG